MGQTDKYASDEVAPTVSGEGVSGDGTPLPTNPPPATPAEDDGDGLAPGQVSPTEQHGDVLGL